jgi:hypothetical protein
MVYYNSFTVRQLSELFILLRDAWERQAFLVYEDKLGYWSIEARNFYGDVLYRYEFLSNDRGYWNVLRCSGMKSMIEREVMEKSRLCFGSFVTEIKDDSTCPGAYLVLLGEAISLRSLSKEQTLAVCRAMIELITYDTTGNAVEQDEESLTVVMKHFYPQLSSFEKFTFRVLLDKAAKVNLDEACTIIKGLPNMTKNEFKLMTKDVVRKIRQEHRKKCADKLFEKCEIL